MGCVEDCGGDAVDIRRACGEQIKPDLFPLQRLIINICRILACEQNNKLSPTSYSCRVFHSRHYSLDGIGDFPVQPPIVLVSFAAVHIQQWAMRVMFQ